MAAPHAGAHGCLVLEPEGGGADQCLRTTGEEGGSTCGEGGVAGEK